MFSLKGIPVKIIAAVLAVIVLAAGFYRIRTTETDLGLLFITLLAFARSGASDDRGGSRKTLLNTIKNLQSQ